MRENDSGRKDPVMVDGTIGAMMDSGGSPTPPPPRPRDAADVADAVAQAAAAQRSLRVVGRGTWLDAGRPVACDALLDLADLNRIVEYTPGDLTITVLAGTTLATIHEATAAHGQWLSLDPFGSPGATLGATLATASAGPLAATVGHPRDISLGLEVVTGSGERIRAGGRVVKNVAGFDLVRLQVGAWGTLGVLTEATVRLRGVPEVDRTVMVPVPSAGFALEDLLRQMRHLPGVPTAAELLNPRLAHATGAGDSAALLVRLTGNAEAVDAQERSLRAFGECVTAGEGVWRALASSEGANATVLRLSDAPARLSALWTRMAERLAAFDPAMHATPGRGIVRVLVDTSPVPDPAALLASLRDLGTCIVERAPAPVWDLHGATAVDRLSRGLRSAFDPRGILNPGILGHVRS